MADPVIKKLRHTAEEVDNAVSKIDTVIDNENKIDPNAIPSGAITGPKLGANSVTQGKIAPGTIEARDINQSAFDSTLQEKGKLAEAKVVGDKFKEQGDSINDLALEMNNNHPKTNEKGFYVVDKNGNIGMRYNEEEGLDFAKISANAIEVLKNSGISGKSNVVSVNEAGFFVVDNKLNIGLKLDLHGKLFAKNILDFEFV